MTNPLPTRGWTPERRARQAALIARWQPWRRSTGPRTDAGKARSAANALKHGFRSRAYMHRIREVRRVLRLSARNLALARAFLRASHDFPAPAALATPRQWHTMVTRPSPGLQYRTPSGRSIVGPDIPVRMKQGGGRC
jgi:hypothetical protein